MISFQYHTPKGRVYTASSKKELKKFLKKVDSWGKPDYKLLEEMGMVTKLQA